MTFMEDSAWPEGLLNIFRIASQEKSSQLPFENRYFGAFDKLLNYCFGNSFSYFVSVQSPPESMVESPGIPQFYFVVFDSRRKPVLFVIIKDDPWADLARCRQQVDSWMRDQYDHMLNPDACSSPRLWGLSCMGTKTRVYCGDVESREITPALQTRPDPNCVYPPTFLRDGWKLDLLSQEGFFKMKEIVKDIMNMA